MKVGFVSLGCSKNLVDTERVIGLFKNKGFSIINQPEEAEMIVVNTCGFIESAKEEAINTIIEMAQYKNQNCRYLVVMGCLVQRYKKELIKALPEVDLFIKYEDYDSFWLQIQKLLFPETDTENGLKKEPSYLDRIITTGENYAYIKIADGCNNCCTFCAIPGIRGKFCSRSIDEIIEEANLLAKKGIKEIILIAQDTTKYGIDLYGRAKLTQLLEEISKIEGIVWIRFLYAYPESITDELIQIVKNNPKVCPYFDIPIQHISDHVLKRMNRKSTGKTIRDLIKKLRNEIPEVIIRTTIMVGFPGETKEEFEELYDFIKEAKFDKLGAFAYSKEEGTPAEKLKEHVHPSTKKSRYKKIMELQQQISNEKLKEKVGKEYPVLIETKTFDGKYYVGRSYMDTPDIDGLIYCKVEEKALEGKIVNCKIIEVQGYDLIGEIEAQS